MIVEAADFRTHVQIIAQRGGGSTSGWTGVATAAFQSVLPPRPHIYCRRRR